MKEDVVVQMGEMRNVYKVLIGMPKGKKPKHRWGIS
jgi:hypothetical protein